MIDKNKTYRTRDGREVKIFMTDTGMQSYPIMGAYRATIREWWSCLWTKDGEASADPNDARNLIEVKPRIKREVWVNVYRDRTTCLESKAIADWHAGISRIACLKLTLDFEEGDGL